MMMRAMTKSGLLGQPGTITYTDWSTVPEWAREAIRLVSRRGLIGGYRDGSFGPFKTATRAEATVLIERLWVLLHP